MPKEKTVLFNDAQLIFMNFEGRPGKFNKEGEKSFSVLIPDEDVAQQMIADGWNVGYLKPQEEGEPERPVIKVKVGYTYFPPNVTLISSKARTRLDEESVKILDGLSCEKVDLIIRAYEYNVNGNQGISAYLKTMFFTIDEDELELRYAAEMDGGSSE